MSKILKTMSPRGDAYGESLANHPENVPVAIHDLTVAYQRKPVLWDIDLDIPEGKLVGIVGPNGAGKSTLMKACLDLIPKASGEVGIYGKPYAKQSHLVGYVPQRESVDWDFPVSVLDVVTMGTYRELGWFKWVKKPQKERAMQAMEKVGIAHLAKRQISELSGGQQQRVFLARALAQDAQIYFMDEPFAAVDAATEEAIVSVLQELNKQGKTCLVVHHDLSTVARYFDWLILLNLRVVDSGPIDKVFTKENLEKTYGGSLSILNDAAESLVKIVH